MGAWDPKYGVVYLAGRSAPQALGGWARATITSHLPKKIEIQMFSMILGLVQVPLSGRGPHHLPQPAKNRNQYVFHDFGVG